MKPKKVWMGDERHIYTIGIGQDCNKCKVLWQPLDTKSNDHTSNKSLRQISSGKFTRELDKEPLLN